MSKPTGKKKSKKIIKELNRRALLAAKHDTSHTKNLEKNS